MNDESQLVSGLRDLARGMEDREAPPRVEAALLKEFRRRKAVARTWRWAAAIAAGLALAVAGMEFARPRTPAPVASVAAPPRTEAPAPTPIVAVPPPARAKKPMRRSAPRPKPAPPQPAVEGFVPVLYSGGLSPLESGRVVRVKLPASALASFGIPVSEDRPGERIQTDVLLGEDGTARAVRFVNFRR